MASCSQPNPDQPDLLSSLPDELLIKILSSLPTHMAARTSILPSRFRHLWEASPCVHLIAFCREEFITMFNRALRLRNPSHPLVSLSLEYSGSPLPVSFRHSLCAKVSSFGVQHLTVRGRHLIPIIPMISSINCLQSLSLPVINFEFDQFPSGITLTCLKSLSLELHSFYSKARIGQFFSELCCLEDLHLDTSYIDSLSLSSQSIRKLKLIMHSTLILHSVSLILPSLESLHLEIQEYFNCNLFHIHGEVPMLQRAVISLNCVRARDFSAITRLLSFISNVKELSMCLKEPQDEKHPIPFLFEPGKDVPNFHNLKHLDVHLCMHEHNFEAVIIMLHNCPNLE
ncbi:F-box family protein [Rhynchospora pubera]|uniref:F-box family protein n=1 Tax=Rhynchospora pubera TaxID=906938 RepID=A0AAV8HAE9_9POAL|nr:F-box family protein [Rhynchospora pubera]